VSKEACRFCGSSEGEVLFDLHERPEGETKFPSIEEQAYRRQIQRCRVCGHCISICEMDVSGMYSGEYVNATYYDADGVRQNFERIISLPASKSDNTARTRRVCDFASGFFGDDQPRRLLDIGSGLAVFPHAMKQRGWDCTALDPDPRAAEHARRAVGVESICADFMTERIKGKYSVITLNKVLEHVPEPVTMAARARTLLDPSGFLYIEVPDAEAAASGGPEREEFFIEHLHVFSFGSLALLASQAGYRVLRMERLQEPSSKFTLAAFLRSATP
jgi:SAM-dependent methyltransferase